MLKIRKKSSGTERKAFLAWMAAICILLIFSYAVFMGIKSKPRRVPGESTNMKAKKSFVDPVCSMDVNHPGQGHIEYRAKHYYFCSIVCREAFEKEPEKYLNMASFMKTENEK